MDRVFLDANVLFSAAYRADSAFRSLWAMPGVALVTSVQAVDEAYTALGRLRPGQLTDLVRLVLAVEVVPDPPPGLILPAGVNLPEKDAPILLAAIQTKATHLLTGDQTHFGPYYGQMVAGVTILPPAEYLQGRQSTP